MELGLGKNLIVRRRLVFVIVRLHVIFAHREILELVPHQDAAEVRVAVEDDAVESKDFTFLKLRASLNGRQ